MLKKPLFSVGLCYAPSFNFLPKFRNALFLMLFAFYGTLNAQISFTGTFTGDVTEVGVGTFNVSVLINKQLTINGPNAAISAIHGSRVSKARLLDNVRISVVEGVIFYDFDFFEVPTTTTRTIYIQGNSNNFSFRNNLYLNNKYTAVSS